MPNLIVYTKVFFYGVAWWLIPILFLYLYKRKLSKFPVDVIIYEKRGENLVVNFDVAGRFTEPVECYKLKNAKDTLPIPQYDWILQNLRKPTNLFEKVAMLLSGKMGAITLFKYGSKQYKPISAKISDGKRIFKEVKDKHGNPIWVTVYEPINVKREMSRLDFEVIDWDDINHMTQEIRAIIQRRSPVKNLLERYGPMIGLGLVAFVFIIALYYGYKLNTEAAERYISAARGGAPAPAPEPVELPLDKYLPD